MAKADAVSAAILMIQNEQAQALTDGVGSAYDAGASDQKAADGTGTSPSDQAVIDGLNAQVAALTAQDASDVASLRAAQASLASVQQQLSDLSTKEAGEAALIQGLTGSLSVLQNVVVELQAVLAPPPVPAPAPVPDQPVTT